MGLRKAILLEKRGITAIIVAICLIMFLGLLALAVDVGYMLVTRTELQRVADGAALAGARVLGHTYEPMSYQAQVDYVVDGATETAIRNAAKDVASLNRSGGMNGIVINDADIIIGNWASGTINPTLASPDAVRVIARRDASANGPIVTFFARVLGINSMNASTIATAALTGQSTMPKGGLPIPVGISLAKFQSAYCNTPIKFYPTGSWDGCAGWNVYTDPKVNANALKKLLQDLKSGARQSPETIAYETQFNFTGGTDASAFPYMQDLFNYMKTRDDDNNPNTWTTEVAVYDSNDCSNPHGTIMIVGFATVVINSVQTSPEKTITGIILCDNVEPGRGGGSETGTKGSIPGLVQ
jgi:Flp pilus assembly protein TadG